MEKIKSAYFVKSLTSWSGLTTDQHLTSIGIKNPVKLGVRISEALVSRYGNTLENFLNMFPIRRFETDDEYTWDIVGEEKRNIPLR